MLSKEKLGRINYFAKKAKTEGLTELEKKEQKELREEYLKVFRKNFRNQLDCIKIEEQ